MTNTFPNFGAHVEMHTVEHEIGVDVASPRCRRMRSLTNPAPPEGIPDNSEAIAVCTSPDVCKTPRGSSTPPIPYSVYGLAGDDGNYSPDVFYNGFRAMRYDSVFTRTYGDEPGTAFGVKSGTVGDIVEPTSHSPIVRINGSPAIDNPFGTRLSPMS